ncbi:bacterial luciferase family protein [Pseudooceanicola batsensis HTCC2597]|uniref:Luciferase-like monooxygenase n=1 Tax=Pseudooceanicola batsensis (strain ATCC BAA-863 / DSM 15984 / KCTC 12145 / HTCC2597) TaxID=252305 RepID=A3TX49_PSEBH|nr:LLM class flavin-dependent oxidoreductase [Pseudooceanicola batsensis]EAQ03409.1 bacterial luciferase family protein [Pseudooceanicola batsensis HTCC2597]
MRYSLLDLAPIPEGGTARDAIANSVSLAQHAEGQGYHRLWLAEHHNMPGIASSATSVLIGHIAGATSRIRVGSGGVMLPNHAPLVIAEQFGTLATIHGDRIDLGLGRAPGTDMETARALRRHMSQQDTFPQDVLELLAHLGPAEEGQRVRAIPGTGTGVPIWILGSSLYGAQLAAHLGLPYAFASHFAPEMLAEAGEVYRRSFQPSAYLDKPHFMVAMNVFAAETEEEALYWQSSAVLGFARLRAGMPGPLPRPVERLEDHLEPSWIAAAQTRFTVSAIGSEEMVKRQTATILETYQPDEVMVNAQIHGHAARLKSVGIAARVLRDLGAVASV